VFINLANQIVNFKDNQQLMNLTLNLMTFLTTEPTVDSFS